MSNDSYGNDGNKLQPYRVNKILNMQDYTVEERVAFILRREDYLRGVIEGAFPDSQHRNIREKILKAVDTLGNLGMSFIDSQYIQQIEEVSK